MGECCVSGVYRRREPHLSPLYQVVEDYYAAFERCYDDRFERQYGFWRPIIREKFFKFTDCGDLRNGFARIRCKSCGTSLVLAFSCKTNCLCPSCVQRRALDFGDWVVEEVIPGIPVVSCTFTIPKMLRIYFKFDHSLYPELSRCAWETMKECFQAAFDTITLVPGMITGIHTSGHVLNFHPHVHAVTSAGCFDKDGTFYRIPCMPDEEQLEKLFMHKVLKMMMSLDKIDEDVVERLTSWTHSGFNVHVGDVIVPDNREARERAARYLVKSCVSLEKMTYVPQEGKVQYGDARDMKVYDALDFLALLSCHITGRWERRVIAYGYWSNKSRGMTSGRFRSALPQNLSSRTWMIMTSSLENYSQSLNRLVFPRTERRTSGAR